MNRKLFAKKKFEREMAMNRHFAKAGLTPLILVLDHLRPDYNIGKIFRSAEFFSLQEIHLIDTPYFDPGPSMGAARKVPAKFFSRIDESFERLKKENYSIFAFDGHAKKSIHECQFPSKCAFVLGHEEFGLSFKPHEIEGVQAVRIPGLGQTESLNVSIAATIGVYEYVRQHPQVEIESSTFFTLAK